MNLNVTYNGVSVDKEINVEFGYVITDDDVKRIALEELRTGGFVGLVDPNAADTVFRDYIVDRLRGGGNEERLFLRPKVPFGA